MPQLTLEPIAGLTPEQSETLRRDLLSVVANDIVAPVAAEKSTQFSMLRRAQFYWRGHQYLYPVRKTGGIVDWSPIVRGQQAFGRKDLQASYTYTNNVYRGDGRKFIGVVGQRTPSVKAVPDIHGNEDHERRAKKADRILGILRKAWRVNRMQRQIAYNLWNAGTCFIYRTVRADRYLYGTTKVPRYEERQVVTDPGGFRCVQCGAMTPIDAVNSGVADCQQCGAPLQPEMLIPPTYGTEPVEVGHEEYDNAMVEARVCSAFTVTVPFGIEDLDQTPWLLYEYEEDKGALIAAYPELEAIADSAAEPGMGDDAVSSMGIFSRAQVETQEQTLRPSGDGRWLYRQVWLTPRMFTRLRREHREAFRQMYPEGCRLVIVAGRVIRTIPEKLVEHWTAIKPDVSETIWADPIGKDMIPVQDVVNNFLNINVETGERSIPATIFNPRMISVEQLKKHAGLPGEMIPALPQPGGRLDDGFVKMPVAEMKPDLASFAGGLIEQGRENSGILRPIFGGDSGSQTATEAEQKRVQGLMQLNVPWDECRTGWEDAYYHGAKLFARHLASGFTMPGLEITDQDLEDMREVLAGGWHCESEEGMPMTWSQRRAITWDLLSKGPDVLQLTGAADPDNKQKIMDAVGMPDWKIPYLDDVQKMKRNIKELLADKPIFDPAMGPMPSIPVDPLDDAKFMLDVIRQWNATEEAGRIKKANPEGYANVLAYAKQLRAMMAPPPVGDPTGPQQQQRSGAPAQASAGSPAIPGAPQPALPGGPSEMAPEQGQLPMIQGAAEQLPIQ